MADESIEDIDVYLFYATGVDLVGFRVIELTVGAGQRMKKSGFDSFRYGFYPVNRQASIVKACELPPFL